MEITVNTSSPWSALRPAIETMIRSGLSLEEVQEMFSKAYVRVAVEMHQGNMNRASRAINVHRNTIYHYIGKR